MERKLRIAFEFLIFIALIIYFTIKLVVPEIREQFGSSDRFINTSHYQNMFEVDIDNNVRFALVVNEEKKIYHIMFFDLNSTCLYNQNIEGSKLDIAVSNVIRILASKYYIRDLSNITITRYGEEYYSDFLMSFNSYTNNYVKNIKIIEKKNTLSNLRDELQLECTESDDKILRSIDLYSKEFARQKKNNASKDDEIDVYISDINAKRYTDNVYKKIEKFILSNNITNMDKNDIRLQISLIPADPSLKYYPSNNSWYYVKDGKIYAYIEIIDGDKVYSYCYNGSIDINKKGECV